MIDAHAFNSAWWDAAVGIVRDPALFSLARDEALELLSAFVWVEYRGAFEEAPHGQLHDLGFRHADTQLQFRLGLSAVKPSPSSASLEAVSADVLSPTWNPEEVADFEHERYALLAGANRENLNSRYALWAAQMAATNPEWCLTLMRDGRVQGWFLSKPEGNGLNLELAMLARTASISGLLLYERALAAYRDRGARIGFARFSARNTAVLNIYASLGARFVRPLDCWLWQR